MTTLYLIRHGETVTNNSGIFAGIYDAQLTPLGIQQNKQVSEHFKSIHLDAVYSSDISRAAIMANCIAEPHNLHVNYDTRLREIYLGSWEGCHVNEIQAQWPQLYNTWICDQCNCTTPNGENIMDVCRRVMAGIKDIICKHPQQTVLCVTHGLALKTIYMQLTHTPPSQFRELTYVSNASITTITSQDEKIDLLKYGDDTYLDKNMVSHIFPEA